MTPAPSARTNSPLIAPSFFNTENTSSTVDPGLMTRTSRSAVAVRFLDASAAVYMPRSLSQRLGATPP
eukprot:CAMPEP_0183326468 /NCGR_PEP_ID=MMETSP0160_2-20130417/82255_1 /TAXON_ID=2839 ORGANISM="Odontella Sinensis, Strain Grunow 1884" /NCGR_SAMPLE_ID=MMETSP0160_2 /ASSEMBLY_ACC=CAM_ASM_000250 /LENGTH=67 /DNA_ID=CAMNT_0025494459 /DNA_START=123 /DNA_END=323 /DNA_ORIENTATION=-